MAVSVIRNFIAKQLFKKKGAISNNKAVEFSANALENRLINLGIDPNLITSEKELNQILAYVKQAEDRSFQQQFGSMLDRSGEVSKKGEVFDMSGKKLDSSQGIMGGTQINKQTLKEGLMKTDNPFSDLVKTTDQKPKTLKEREAEVLARMEKDNKAAVQRIRNRKMVEEAIDNASPGFAGDRKYDAQLVADDLAEKRFGKEFYDLDQKQQMDLYDEALEGLANQKRDMPDPEDFSTGGRAGFKTGLGKRFLDLLKNKKMFRSRDDVPTSVFSEKKGPITIEDMANISPNELRKIRRTQELGLYGETPEILKAGNLFDRFTKKVGSKRVIDYDRAEVILNRKLRGDETLNELLQIEYQTRPGRADGGRIGYKDGPDIKLFPRARGSQVEQEVGPGIKISERDIDYGITGLVEGDKFFGGASIDKGKVKVDVVTPEGDTLFKDTIGKDDAVNFILGMGDPKGDKFEIRTDKDLENMKFIIKTSFAGGGRAGFKIGSIDKARRAFLKTMGVAGAGITALKTGLLGFGKGAATKQVAEEVVKKSTTTPPAYFFELAESIKKFGRVSDGPQERLKIHSMPAKDGKSELMLTEDIGTGEMQIKKISKEGDDMITEVQTMDYSPSSALSDESGKVAGQYDEYTEYNSRIIKDEFNDPIIEDGIKIDEIMDEVKDAPSIKKASGGIARMLGE